MNIRRLLGVNKKAAKESFIIESYAQEGEDNILARIFGNRKNGFFVDIGAHHPKRFSNTYKFYKSGWRGINIEAMPGSMDAFKVDRPEDINLEIPVSDKEEDLTFYTFNEPAINTFSKELAEERNGKDNYRIEKTIIIHTKSLDDILDKHLPANQSIQFMTVDTEGYDYKVLSSNNWTKYRPEIILFEGDHYYMQFKDSKLYSFVLEQGYEFIAKTVSTYFFKDMR